VNDSELRKIEGEVDILFSEPAMECDEICLTENNLFVAATATCNDAGDIGLIDIPRG